MKKNILEIRFHGRGGQGAKTAGDLLAQVALELGKYIQAFPEYGPERAGAPMKSYVRISDKPINIHCGVENPDIVVVIDPTLLGNKDITEGIDKNTTIVVNTYEDPQNVRKKLNLSEGKIFTVDATKIALEETGLPFPNTPMLGALIKATEVVPLNELKERLKIKFGKKLTPEKLQGNLNAVERAYKETKSE
ncbi:MAG: 2-oxoacid:acceptor oxidoreductase family protein [Endomicrobiia bacterium]